MIPEKRQNFNQNFSEKNYLEIVEHFMQFKYPLDFRLSESPIFLTRELEVRLHDACSYIIQYLKNTSLSELEKSIPEKLYVPRTPDHPHFLAIDFGICQNEKGEILPQLIEGQAFPSLFYFQKEYEKENERIYGFTPNVHQPTDKAYAEIMKRVILNGHPKEEVVLLEIAPEKQKTAIDFALTEEGLGIESICLTQVEKRGRQLYYKNSNGITYPIKRIYNRIIWDELLEHKELESSFSLTDDVEVEWATHPNWFFMFSKNVLPRLKHECIPTSYFLKDVPEDIDLSQYVLKPLYSFAGKGVDLNPNAETLADLEHPENYILQKKVSYAPLFEDVNGEFSKAEIRMLYTWADGEENPRLMTNLVRMTKADMVNVSFNKKDAIWIGSSIAYFEKE